MSSINYLNFMKRTLDRIPLYDEFCQIGANEYQGGAPWYTDEAQIVFKEAWFFAGHNNCVELQKHISRMAHCYMTFAARGINPLEKMQELVGNSISSIDFIEKLKEI